MISMEGRRSARTRKSFVLMLLQMGEHASARNRRISLRKVLSALSTTVRETDVVGWYREDAVVGVMFTEIALDDQNALPAPLMTRVGKTLKQHLIPKEFQELSISFHLFANVRAPELDFRQTHPVVYSGISTGTNETAI